VQKGEFPMQLKGKLAYIALSCVLLLSGVVLLINVLAQAPKRAQIVFMSERDGDREIYVMDTNGKNQRNITNQRLTEERTPSWSPDGKKIAFLSDRNGDCEIYVIDSEGKNPRNLTNHPAGDSYPSWSPDGQRIAFVSDRDGNCEIYVMDADGKNQRRLTKHSAKDMEPDWFDPAVGRPVSPAGKLRVLWGWIKQR